MKFQLTFLLFFIYLSLFPQVKTPLSPQISSIDIKGNNNIVKVTQGNSVFVYNLEDSKNAADFLKYLKSLPTIKDLVEKIFKITTSKINSIDKTTQENNTIAKEQIRLTKEQNELLKSFVLKSNESNYFDKLKFEEELGFYIKEIEKLKKEYQELLNNCDDGDLAKILRIAAEKLDLVDATGYQETLESYKKSMKLKIRKKQSEYALLPYLQAKNSLKNYKYDIALNQINEALDIDSLDEKFLEIKGDIFYSKNMFVESLDLYKRLVSIASNDSIKFQAYNQIGRIYLSLGEFKLALDHHFKCLYILQSQFQENFSASSMTYNNIGTVYKEIRDFNKSIKFYEKALSILPKNDTINLATLYNNLGLSYFHKKQFGASLIYYDKAYNLLYPKVGDYNLKTIMLGNNKAAVYRELKQYDTALKYYEDALIYLDKLFGYPTPLTGYIYNNISSIYLHKEDSEKALEYLFKSIEIIELQSSPTNYNLVNCYHNVAKILFNKKNYEQAKEYFLKELKIEEPVFGVDHMFTKYAATDLAVLYIVQERTDSATFYFTKIGFNNFSDEEKLKILFPIAKNINTKLGKEEAVLILQYALKSIRDITSVKGTELFNIYNLTGKLYCELNNKKTAQKYIKQARKVNEELIRRNVIIEMTTDILTKCE